MDWLEKMNAAFEYIEKHLDSEISYDQAAQIACCSTFYFSYVVGGLYLNISVAEE